mmetsp:Transcript_21231/g.54381  ORF Transcript_21231/g.54381 Transcript_21231/m.54381 type:complete len:205 (+) Transcript_21231:1125-1739(+)
MDSGARRACRRSRVAKGVGVEEQHAGTYATDSPRGGLVWPAIRHGCVPQARPAPLPRVWRKWRHPLRRAGAASWHAGEKSQDACNTLVDLSGGGTDAGVCGGNSPAGDRSQVPRSDGAPAHQQAHLLRQCGESTVAGRNERRACPSCSEGRQCLHPRAIFCKTQRSAPTGINIERSAWLRCSTSASHQMSRYRTTRNDRRSRVC